MSLLAALDEAKKARLEATTGDILQKGVPFTLGAYAASRVSGTKGLVFGAGIAALGTALARVDNTKAEAVGIAGIMAGIGAFAIGVGKKVFG